MTATLSWFRDRVTSGTTDYFDHSFDNLDLELWSTLAGNPVSLISESTSRYNNTEHFQFEVPATGQYMLRVRWTDEVFDVIGDINAEQYGLAWATVAVPEPATFSMMAMMLAALCFARRRS